MRKLFFVASLVLGFSNISMGATVGSVAYFNNLGSLQLKQQVSITSNHSDIGGSFTNEHQFESVCVLAYTNQYSGFDYTFDLVEKIKEKYCVGKHKTYLRYQNASGGCTDDLISEVGVLNAKVKVLQIQTFDDEGNSRAKNISCED